MSVINQMLKDLDKRQGEQATGQSVAAPIAVKNRPVKAIILLIGVIVIINIAGILAWQLYAENQQLKAQAQQASSMLNHQEIRVEGDVETTKVTTPQSSTAIDNLQGSSQTDDQGLSLFPAQSEGIQALKNEEKAITVAIIEDERATVKVNSKDAELSGHKSSRIVVEPLLPVADKQTNVMAKQNRDTESAVQAEPENVAIKHQPSLTISRKQLSPQALAKKKIADAERAMEVNELAKAASLFEEVLLLTPEHETARKQLAALWYGKKAYQDAINLLSQGIALAPPAEEMRLMAARIYFEQGQARQAVNLLSPVSHSERVELQVLLASVAAELNEHEIASTAYQKLLQLEPTISRWWLGLAVSLDSQGQFKSASEAYNQAIAKGNLSMDALRFSRQRLAELGE